MSASKPVECFHRITQFQAHRFCSLLASICEKQCQQVHKSDKDEILVVSLEMMQEQFTRIMDLINTEINKYSNRLRNIYHQILQEVEKRMIGSLKEMQKQISAEIMKNLTIEKTLVEKLQNKRYERIKCFQLMSLMEEIKPQQKIKKSALSQIFEKFKNQTNTFRESLFKGKPIVPDPATSQKSSPTSQNAVNTAKIPQPEKQKQKLINNPGDTSTALTNNNKYYVLYEQKKKDFKQLEQRYEQLKYQKKVLVTQNSNLQRQLSKVHFTKVNNKKKKLIIKTWNIAQVITKKIKKVRNQNQRTEAQSLNKENSAINIQQVQPHPPKDVQEQDNHKIPEQVVNEEIKPVIMQIQQNQQKPNPQPPKQSAEENEQMQDQEEDFFEYLRKKKLV